MAVPALLNKLNIFISYSRADETFAEDIRISLEDRGYTVEIDKHSIRRGTDWKERLGGLIAACDTVVFIVSPNSARSEICHWEAAHAEKIGKRIIPVLFRGLHELPLPREDGTVWPQGRVEAPPQLARLNYVRFDERRSFPLGLRELIQAIEDDIEWIDAHSRLATRARDWGAGGRPDNRLMSGTDIATAKRLMETRKASAPPMLPEQLDFIHASELNEEARQRVEDLRARQLRDAELATANAKAEAAHMEAEAARRQQKLTAFALAISLMLASIAGLSSWWAWQKTWEAQILADDSNEQQKRAEEQTARAERQKERAEREAKAAQEAVKVVNILFDQVTGETSALSSREIRDKDVFEKLSREAESGNVTAKVNLGLLYWLGQGVTKDAEFARVHWEAAAAAGNAGGMTGLGMYYLADDSVAKNEAKAREWLEKAAAAGDPTAMYFLAGLYRIASDAASEATALKWFERAAENGQIDAMYDLAGC